MVECTRTLPGADRSLASSLSNERPRRDHAGAVLRRRCPWNEQRDPAPLLPLPRPVRSIPPATPIDLDALRDRVLEACAGGAGMVEIVVKHAGAAPVQGSCPRCGWR